MALQVRLLIAGALLLSLVGSGLVQRAASAGPPAEQPTGTTSPREQASPIAGRLDEQPSGTTNFPQDRPPASADTSSGSLLSTRTADGPERPEWFPILGGVRIGCTTGNPNANGVVDDTCHQASDAAGGVVPYHPWPAIDIYAPEGTPTRASGAGTVISVGHNTATPESDSLAVETSDAALAARAGGWIVVAHADGPNSVYKHSGEWLVVPGDHVEPGQVIGIIGYPGTSTAHLHYDEQDPDVRFNDPEARVPFETMSARDPSGEIITYPDVLGTTDWTLVNQGTQLTSTGWQNQTTVGSESELRAAVTSYSTSIEDGPFTVDLGADITLTDGPLVYEGDELLMIDGDPDLDGDRRRMTASPGSRLVEAPDPDAALELRGVDLLGGAIDGDGGLVDAAGPITLVNATASGGAASGSGGALNSGEWVGLVRAEVFDNSAGEHGGGVRATRVAVVDSTLHHNTATGSGGGAATTAAPLTGTHIGGDHAQTDSNRVSNSTISLNQAGSSGGGISATGDLYVQNSTIHQNTSATGSDSVAAVGTLTTAATAFSTLSGRANCEVGVTRSFGGNLDSDTSCGLNGPEDIVGRPARLGTLRGNGGPTLTHHPLSGSPLIDAFVELPDTAKGRFSHAPPCSPTGRAADQRSSGPLDTLDTLGYGSRFSKRDPAHAGLDKVCDIGAVEAIHGNDRYRDIPPWLEATARWISSDDRDTPRIMGPDTTSFAPDLPITRAQFANALYGFAGRPSVESLPRHDFTDVGAWVDEAVTWISSDPPGPGLPIMTGYPDDRFRGDRPVNRGQLVRALARLTGDLPEPEPRARQVAYTDVPPWIETSVRWITLDHDGTGGTGQPIMVGFPDRTFRPEDATTRGQFASALYRLAGTPAVWNAGDGTPVDADGDLTIAGLGFPVGALWAPL